MKVADLFAMLRVDFDKRSAKKARAELGHTLDGAQRKLNGLGRHLGKLFSGYLALRAASDTMDFEESLTRLNITAKGGLGTLEEMRDKILDISDSTGVAKEQVAQGASKFIELTGDVEGAAAAMGLYAKVAQATGANMDDVAGSAAALGQQFKIGPDQMEKMFSIVIEGGKQGAAEFKDLAVHMAGLGASMQQFAGSQGTKAAAELAAMLQDVTAATGGNTAVATTQIKALMTGIGQASGKLKEHGIRVFDAAGNYKNFADIIRQMKAKNFSNKQMLALFPNVRAARGAQALLDDTVMSWENLTEATLNSNAVAEDYAQVQASLVMRLKKAWNFIKNLVVRAISGIAHAVDDAITTFMEWKGAMTVLSVLVVGLAGAFAFLGVTAAIAGAATFVAWLAAIAPFLLLVAIIGVLALALEDVIATFQGKDTLLRRFWDNAVTYGKEVLQDFFDWVDEKLINMADDIVNTFDFMPGMKTLKGIHERNQPKFQRASKLEGAGGTRGRAAAAHKAMMARQNAELALNQDGTLTDSQNAGNWVESGGSTINVEINGVVDPMAVGAEVEKVLVNQMDTR